MREGSRQKRSLGEGGSSPGAGQRLQAAGRQAGWAPPRQLIHPGDWGWGGGGRGGAGGGRGPAHPRPGRGGWGGGGGGADAAGHGPRGDKGRELGRGWFPRSRRAEGNS